MGNTVYRAFITIQPGLEPWLAEELAELGCEEGRQLLGGIELRLDTAQLWTVAHRCRLGESLRVRIGRFDARSFEALAQGLEKLPWVAYVPRGTAPRVQATAHKSRLYHSDALAERSLAAIRERLGAKGPPGDDATLVFVRLDHDRAEVSVDASGERLHKRGWREHVVRGSLRETLAAACLRIGGVGEAPVIWDPFCGSGTLLLEALTRRAGGVARRGFAFEAWPSHDGAAYQAWLDGHPIAAYPEGLRLFGSDSSARAIEAAENNLAALLLPRAGVRLARGDFEEIAADIPAGAVVTNIPYGRQVGTQAALNRDFARLGALLRRRVDLDPVVVLSGSPSFPKASGLKWTRLVAFRNQGVPVEILRLQRRSRS